MLDWLNIHKEWVFSGAGVTLLGVLIGGLLGLVRYGIKRSRPKSPDEPSAESSPSKEELIRPLIRIATDDEISKYDPKERYIEKKIRGGGSYKRGRKIGEFHAGRKVSVWHWYVVGFFILIFLSEACNI